MKGRPFKTCFQLKLVFEFKGYIQNIFLFNIVFVSFLNVNVSFRAQNQ